MSEHHDEHGSNGHEGHSAFSIGEWLDTHMSGAIVPFGEKMETLFEHTLVLSVNGFFPKISKLCLIVITPVILVEFALHAAGF